MRRGLLVCGLFASWALGSWAGPATVVRDIVYNEAAGQDGLGDLYLPAGYTPDTPVALAIHGGGWSGGDRASWAGVAEFLCNNLGFVVFNIEYRRAAAGQYWPCCGNDCIDAANYLLSDTFEQLFPDLEASIAKFVKQETSAIGCCDQG